ncbi:MAG: BACON domain-containing carbohydrate-binding protein, partial [Deltaproteobacteria bacterium]
MVHAGGYQFLSKWGSNGSGDTQFNYPYAVAIDPSKNVYVTDCGNRRVAKFTSSGEFVKKWGSEGSGDGQFSCPIGIAVDKNGYVYVVDNGNKRIQKFTSEGDFVVTWGTSGSGDGQFSNPWGVAVDPGGNVYVSETSNSKIQKFNSDGSFITKWGTYGTGDTQFYYPKGVAIDSSGNVYVADSNNSYIKKFDSNGTFIKKFGGPYSTYSTYHPSGVAVSPSGSILLTDGDNQVQEFTADGTFIRKWGSKGTGDGQFNNPYFPGVDAQGNVYVPDQNNHRIQKFAPCSFTLTSSQQSFSSNGGEGSVQLTASSSSCSWTATPAADWITIKSGSTGTGNGTVTYSVAANTEIVPRTGAIAVDTLTFTVTEAEKSILSATTQNFPVEGGTGSFNVVAPSSAPSLQWTAESDNWWITIINGNAGMGNGTVTFMVASNPETASRTGTITVSGQTFTVTQDALTISLELKAGWNFISFRLQPNDRSIENILAPVLSKVRIVWGYDNKLKKWLHYKPGAAGNLLLEMESQKGYWIYMKEAGTIVLAGSSMLPDVELDPGWNLVGYSGTDGAGTAAGVHDYLTDGWITFWTWDKGEWLAAFNGATNLQVKALETLHHNKAYWLKIQSEAYGLIGSAGGTVAGPRASVVVPGGAWAQSAPIQITPVSGSPLGEESHASGVFQITGIPDVFEQPLTIKIKLDRPVVGKALMMVGRDVVNLETGSVFRRYEYLAATEADGYMTAQIPPPATAATPLGISP